VNYGTHHHWYISGFAVLAIFLGLGLYKILTSRVAMETFGIIFICLCVAVALAVALGGIHFALIIHRKHEGHRIEMRARMAIVRVLENEAKTAENSDRSELPGTADHLAILYRTAVERPVIPEQRHNVLSRYQRHSRAHDMVEEKESLPPGDMA
jgi:hypothetical protein